MVSAPNARSVCALNADVVGYSRLLADDFDATSASMVVARDIVDRQVAAHGGTLVNFVGDNFMAVFDQSIRGVQSAIAIATDLEVVNHHLDASRQLKFRMGMDIGEVSVSGGHFEGDALNVAARIQALARSGGLSVSGAVYRELDEPMLRFRNTGAQRLKNIPEPVEVYEFVDLPTSGGGIVTESRLALDIPTIAVLPIHTEGVSDETAAVASVIRADVIHRLASIPELDVIDAGDEGSVGPHGRAVRYMLETGVHQFGARLRLHATVFDVTTMNVVKANKVSTTVEDILDVSDAFADEVGRAIEVELVVGAPAGLYAELDDAEAIEKVYRGWYHFRSDTKEGWNEALRLFGQVADAHPDQPYGWVLSAFANWIGASNGWAPDAKVALETARLEARKGVEVGDPTGMGRTVEAAVMMSSGEVDEAIAALSDVEIVRPTCDVTFGLEGSIKRYLGEWEEAVDLMDVAMRLTGINKPWYPTVKACSLFLGNRFEQAAAMSEAVLEYQPGNIEALLVLAASQHELGLDRRAEATAARVREAYPALDVAEWMDRNPYRDPALVERWRSDLVALELIPTG
jgi:adenylate cyclase